MRTASTLPERAALISTVSPSGVDSAFASAPASSSALTSSALPDGRRLRERRGAEAVRRGRGLAPARSSSFTASTSFQCAAQCSAVVPSACGALTLTRLLTSARSAADVFPLRRVGGIGGQPRRRSAGSAAISADRHDAPRQETIRSSQSSTRLIRSDGP